MGKSELDQNLLTAIEKHGWFGLTVASRAHSDDTGPAFAYSIGFEKTLNKPNIIIMGLRSEVMHGMMWRVFEALKAGGCLEDRAQSQDILDGYTCEFRSVHQSNIVPDYFGYGL